MNRIKLRFVDYSSGYVPEEQLIYKVLSRHFEIDQVSDPDFIISCGLGVEHTKYDRCVKIVWIGENVVPDFNWFDYAIGFDHMDFGDRYLRVPLCAFYESYRRIEEPLDRTDEQLLNRDFCSFVASNPQRDPIVFDFVRELSKYKKVSCGGACLNNVGGRVKDKMSFCAAHKFNVAFENSSSPGYTTEKIMQPLVAGSVPIYYGNPMVEADFNPGCMVRVGGWDDIPRVIDEIVALDKDDAAYLSKCRAPRLAEDRLAHERRLEAFLLGIVERGLACGLSAAYRRNFYGCQSSHRRCLGPVLRTANRLREAAWFGLNLLHGRIAR